MKGVNENSTKLLLANLENEINIKCMELHEKQSEAKLRRVFFSSCVVIFLMFLFQVFFKIFNVNSLIVVFSFQAVALIVVLPIILNINKSQVV